MRAKQYHILSAVLGAPILGQVAYSLGCSEAALRVLCLVYVLNQDGRKTTARKAANLLGYGYRGVLDGANECCTLGWLERQVSRGWALRLTLDGMSVAAKAERSEREARLMVLKAPLPKWPRRYRSPAALRK